MKAQTEKVLVLQVFLLYILCLGLNVCKANVCSKWCAFAL